MADIFISYSQRDRPLVQGLADTLAAAGAKVWWDRELILGRAFQTAIAAEIAACRAAIVVWTPDSVRSEWVYGEAVSAHAGRKLICLRTAGLDPGTIPLPFNALHTDLVDNLAALEAALRDRGLPVSLSPKEGVGEGSDPLPVPFLRRRAVLLSAGATVIAGVAGAAALWMREPSRPVPIGWAELPPGTRLANLTAAPVPTFEAADRSAGRSLDIRSGQVVPATGIDDPVWRATVRGETWLRFPVGGGLFAHVPGASVQVRPPR